MEDFHQRLGNLKKQRLHDNKVAKYNYTSALERIKQQLLKLDETFHVEKELPVSKGRLISACVRERPGATDAKSQAAAQHYRRHIEQTKEPLFLAHPRLFQAYAAETQHSPTFPQSAVGAKMNLVCIRRSMLTTMLLPDGSYTWPGKGIPAMTVFTRGLGMPKGVQPKLKPRLIWKGIHLPRTLHGDHTAVT
ncbi:hypothetical protein LZL87_003360 [Fusarium oxysporum]|nr:hypothetical protein LZL87_003360 [Fusarium oxysporum]